MKGVILAAGYGGRLRPLTLDTPKVLLEIGGKPLIHYSLQALSSAGVSEIAVVVGYQSEKVVTALEETHPDVTFVYNDCYDGDNAISVYSARSFVSDEPFVLCMGDHLVSPGIVQSLLPERLESCVLCVDPTAWHSSQLNDGTRVMVDSDGYIIDIGKQLRVWNAIDTGVFRMNGKVFEAVEHLMDWQGLKVGITDVVRFLGSSGSPFATCDVGGQLWADVDTLEDYLSVGSMLREEYGERL